MSSCGACVHWAAPKAVPDLPGVPVAMLTCGWCHRYPRPIQTKAEHWCGEFVHRIACDDVAAVAAEALAVANAMEKTT